MSAAVLSPLTQMRERNSSNSTKAIGENKRRCEENVSRQNDNISAVDD